MIIFEIIYITESSIDNRITIDNNGQIYIRIQDNIINVSRPILSRREIILSEFFKLFHIIYINNNKLLILNEKTNNYGIYNSDKLTMYRNNTIPSNCSINNISYSRDKNKTIYINFCQHKDNKFYYKTFYIKDDQFIFYNGFYESNQQLRHFIARNDTVYYFMSDYIKIFNYGKNIHRRITLESIERISKNSKIDNAFCVKNNIIYFSLQNSNSIGKYHKNKYTKIKICADMVECSYMVVGLHKEIYMIISRKVANERYKTDPNLYFNNRTDLKQTEEPTKIIIEFGVYKHSYRKIYELNRKYRLKVEVNGEIILETSQYVLIYKPKYIS